MAFKYNIDYKRISENLMPFFLRKEKLKEFIYSAIKGLQDVNDLFHQYTIDTDYKLKFNAQVIYLEHVLNDKFDNTSRTIYIENISNLYNNDYIFNQSEGEPVQRYAINRWDVTINYSINELVCVNSGSMLIYKALTNNVGKNPLTEPADWDLQLYTIAAREQLIPYVWNYNEGLYNFIVWCPLSISSKEPAIKKVINTYKAAGKTYEIKYF